MPAVPGVKQKYDKLSNFVFRSWGSSGRNQYKYFWPRPQAFDTHMRYTAIFRQLIMVAHLLT